MYALYGGKTGRPSVCTLCREKRSPAAGIASRRGWLGYALYDGAPGYEKRCTHKVCT